MKPAPLRLSRLPDSNHIFTSSNKLHMRKISHSVRKPKQEKKMGDYTVRTVPRGRLTVQVVQLMWQLLVMKHGMW
jgi:hypothetical protein